MSQILMDSRASERGQLHAAEWGPRLFAGLRALAGRIKLRHRERELEVCETLSLGDKRLLVVVRYGQQRLLLGATNQSISLLDRLEVVPPHEAGGSLRLRKAFADGDTDAL